MVASLFFVVVRASVLVLEFAGLYLLAAVSNPAHKVSEWLLIVVADAALSIVKDMDCGVDRFVGDDGRGHIGLRPESDKNTALHTRLLPNYALDFRICVLIHIFNVVAKHIFETGGICAVADPYQPRIYLRIELMDFRHFEKKL